MEFFEYENKKIAFSNEGEGPTVFFLHGFGEDQSMWSFLKPSIKEAGFHFFSIDLPGFGHSETIEDCSINGMADIVEYACQKFQLSNIILLGHSMGGYISLAFAEKFGHRLKGWGLIHSHPFADGENKKIARQKSIDFIQKNGTKAYVSQLIPKLFPKDFALNQPKIIASLIGKALNYDPAGIMNALNAMKNRPDRSKVLEQSTVPVLFIIGDKDDLEPQETLVKQTYLPDIASIHILEGVAHMGAFEAPQKTSSLILDFVQFCWAKT